MRTNAILLLALLLPLRAAAGASDRLESARLDSSVGSGAAAIAELSLARRVTQEQFLRLLTRAACRTQPGDFAACLAELKYRRVLDNGFRASPKRPITRQDAALPFARYLELQGGLSGRLFGLGRRNAHQELVAKGIMPDGPPSFYMSGAELIGVLDRARQHLALREVKP